MTRLGRGLECSAWRWIKAGSIWCWAVLVVTHAAPAPVLAARLFDYTHRAFTLSGGLGLRYEDYDYKTGSSTAYSRRTLEEQLKLGSTGFVWDPRFLLFDAGVTLRNRSTDYYNGNSDIDTTGYRLTTTWFRERNPFILYARKRTNSYSPVSGPSYEFTNTNYGFRWRVAPRFLGMVRFGYNRGHTKSDNTRSIPLDEYVDSFNVDGKRSFGKVYRTHSVFNYGYRYYNSEDDAAGRSYRQSYWYMQDSTRFSDKVNLRAGFTYYDRSDKLAAALSGIGNQVDSSYANLNVGLNVISSEQLSHYYTLAAVFNTVNDSRINSYNAVAGLNYRFARYWSSKGAVRLIGTTYDGSSGSSQTISDRTAYGVDGGIAYARSYGRTSARAGYDLGAEVPRSSGHSQDTIITHSLNAGYSGRWSPLYNDSLNYRLNYQAGSRYERADRTRIEHNLNYSVNSQLSGGDVVRTVLNYRDWHETSSGPNGLDNSNRTFRGDVTWNHRFRIRHSLAMSAGAGNTASGSGNGTANYSFWYSQARLAMRPWRRVGFTAVARYEDRSGNTSNLGPRLTLETNLNYSIAKWQARLQYRYHDADYKAGAYKNSWLTLYVTRNFGIRF